MSVLTPVVKKGESLFSFLYRYGQANQVNSFASLGISLISSEHHYNFIPKDVHVQNVVDNLLAHSGLDITGVTLNSCSSKMVNSSASLSERKRYFYYGRVKYCPLCLKEEFYHRLHWDIAMVTMCEKHNVLLFDQCNQCGRSMSILRLMEKRCLCGCVITEEKNNHQMLNPYLIQAQNTIISLLLGEECSVRLTDGIDLGCRSYLEIIDALGKLMDGMDTNNKIFKMTNVQVGSLDYLKQSGSQKRLQINSAITAVAHELITNPNEAMFDEILWSFHGSDRVNSSKVKSLKKLFSFEGGEQYQRFYMRFIGRAENLKYPSDVIRKIPKKIQQSEMLSVNDASSLLNRGRAHLDSLIQRNIIKSEKQIRYGESFTLIDPASLISWQENIQLCIDRPKAMEILNVSVHIMNQLVDAGFILYVHGPKIDNYPKNLLKKEDIGNLVRQITRYSRVEDEAVLSPDFISVQEVASCVKSAAISVVTIFSWLINGNVRSVVSNYENLRSLRVSFSDIRDEMEYMKGEMKK